MSGKQTARPRHDPLFSSPARVPVDKPPTVHRWGSHRQIASLAAAGFARIRRISMLDHRFLLVSLLAAFLFLSTEPALFQHPTAAAATHLVPIEVEPDVVVPDGE
jgi:hypothetical protein